MAWYAEQDPKPPNALDEKGRPTRSLKLRFTVRDHPEKTFAVDLYLRAIKGLVGSLQDPKHDLRTTDPRALAPVALTVESFLVTCESPVASSAMQAEIGDAIRVLSVGG